MITEFKGKYSFLSNFHLCPIQYKSVGYKSVEHAFQVQKFPDYPEIQEEIRNAEKPGEAKRLAKKYKNMGKQRPDWEIINLGLMYELVKEKFTRTKNLRDQLIATWGDGYLQEGNIWNDDFWGFDLKKGSGKNHLGSILMIVRDELIREEEEKDAIK